MENKIKLFLLGIMLLVVLITTYSNHFNNPFQFDDSHSIEGNVYIRDLNNIPLFFTDASTATNLPTNQSYRPMVPLQNAIDYWIGGGLNPFYFHLTIFFWYIVLIILLFFFYQKLLKLSFEHKWLSIIALLSTAWYALHTANAETINYISARSDSFSTLCIVASFVLYQSHRTRKWHLYILTMIIGIYTKQTGVMFVPLLFFYVLFFEENISLTELVTFKNIKGLMNTLKKIAPAFIIGIPLFLFNQFYLTSDTATPWNTLVSKFDYLITQFFVILHYIGNFILPTDLSADPDFKIINSFFDKRSLLGLVVIILLITAAFKTSVNKKTRPIAFGILWFFIALLPTSSILPRFQIANDHRTFFPYIGLIISVCWYIGLLLIKHESSIQKRTIYKYGIPGLAVLIILAYACGTYQRNKIWSSQESLWYDVTIKSPTNGRGLLNYGWTQKQKGNYDVALEYFEKSLQYPPSYLGTQYALLYINIANVKDAMGLPQEAEENFKKALQCRSNFGAYYYYAQWLISQKRSSEAIPLLEKEVEISPNLIGARYLLMELYADRPEWMKLEQLSQETLQIVPNDKTTLFYLNASKNKKSIIEINEEIARNDPTPENYLKLSLIYYNHRLYEKCIEACNEALKLSPNYAEAYNNICSAYNMLGKWDEGVKACEKSLEIKPDYELAKNNLKWAMESK